MRAAVYHRYGPPEVVALSEVPRPTPRDDEVLVKVRATTVTAGDWRLRAAKVPPGFALLIRLGVGIFRPRAPILGHELAGEVEAIGKAVDLFKVGDRVFAYGRAATGSHAEYVAIRQAAAIARIPTTLSFEEAAALSSGGAPALFYLRDKAGVRAGERVLVNGAAGSVGSAAVQLAHHFGATVTGVCSTGNVALVRELGAEQVIDYTRADFLLSGQTFDVILDTVGNCSFANCRALLAPGGRLLLLAASLWQMIGALLRPTRSGRSVLAGDSAERAEDLRLLAQLAEAGQYRPVIDRTYPLERIVEAHARVETHHKKGNVVVTVG